MVGLGGFPGAPPNSGGVAYGTNRDGSVVVGISTTPSFGGTPFRWTAATGMQPLGPTFDTSPSGIAFTTSDDGNVLIGQMSTPHGTEAFRWTADTGVVGLGDLAGGIFQSRAYGISGDGATIVGQGNIDHPSGVPGGYPAAFIWDAAHGMRRLQDVLAAEYDLVLPGWRLNEARAISSDGLAIAGVARNPNGDSEAYLVLLPEPASASLLALATLLFRRRRAGTSAAARRPAQV
ncbi:MAG: hypothetical protein U1A27_00635 [Phycisphaerae bacterium]